MRIPLTIAFVLCSSLVLAQSGWMPGSRQINGGVASISREQQVVQGGARAISKCALGYEQVALSACIAPSGGTVQVDPALGPLQYLENNGAFTLKAPNIPTVEGAIFLLVYNGAAAGAITFSGFSAGTNTGSSLTTTSANQFTISIWAIDPPGGVGGAAGYSVYAHQ